MDAWVFTYRNHSNVVPVTIGTDKYWIMNNYTFVNKLLLEELGDLKQNLTLNLWNKSSCVRASRQNNCRTFINTSLIWPWRYIWNFVFYCFCSISELKEVQRFPYCSFLCISTFCVFYIVSVWNIVLPSVLMHIVKNWTNKCWCITF